jgi:acetolactate synthase-1/2/3 large subunit
MGGMAKKPKSDLEQARTGGQLLMDCLAALGARKGFGVPGESYLAVLDAMYDHQDFEFIMARQEGGAAYMAAAWGKLTGEPGLCFVTRGPGATNASIGVHTAMQDSLPMLLFIGQVGADMSHREAFQEIDYDAFFSPIAKWTVQIDDPDRVPELISRAWITALSGRPGPVIVALPETMLTALTHAPPCDPVVIPEPSLCAQGLSEFEAMLSAAERPLMIVGGTRWQPSAARQIETFASANNIPVAAAFRFHDIIDNHRDCYVGDAGVGMLGYMRELIGAADLIIALNIRFGEMTTAGYSLFDAPNMKAKLIHSHASDAELGKIYAADLPLHAGPNQMAKGLSRMRVKPQSSRTDWAMAARQSYLGSFEAPEQPGDVDMRQIMAHLQAVLPEDAIITHGAGNFAVWPNKFIKYGAKARLLGPQSGSMGFGVPAAIAAKAHDPSRFVLCIAGDGDFQMNGNELGAALQAKLAPVIIILNNASYGTIRMHQERSYPERVSGTDIVNPDFAALARAYGFHGETVDRTDQFAAAYSRACDAQSGAVIEIKVATEAISPRETISSLRAQGKIKDLKEST